MNNLEQMEDNIVSLEDALEKAKAELEFSKFLSDFEEFIPDRTASAEYNDIMFAKRPMRFVRFFLNNRQFLISEIFKYRGGPRKSNTIEIPINKQTNELLNDLKDVLEKHKDILGPITIHTPK